MVQFVRNYKKVISVSILTGVLLISGLYLYNNSIDAEAEKTLEQIPEPSAMITTLVNLPRDEATFYQAVNSVDPAAKALPTNIIGGIIPHEDIASTIVTNFFHQLTRDRQPRTVIVVAEDKTRTISTPSSAFIHWQAKVREIKPAKKAIDVLLTDGVIEINNDIFMEQLPLRNPLQFVGQYMKEAVVVPLLLPEEFISEEELAGLVSSLIKVLNKDTIILFASSFNTQIPEENQGEFALVNYLEENRPSHESQVVVDLMLRLLESRESHSVVKSGYETHADLGFKEESDTRSYLAGYFLE